MNKYATHVAVSHAQLQAKACRHLFQAVSYPVLYENLADVPVTKTLTATSSYISKYIKKYSEWSIDS